MERVVRITKKDGTVLETSEKVDVSNIKPENYGCKPGVITWEYLNALYDAAFPILLEAPK